MVYGRESQNTGCRASLNASFQPTFPALMLPTQLMVSPALLFRAIRHLAHQNEPALKVAE